MSKGIARWIERATWPKAHVYDSPPLAGGVGGGGSERLFLAARNAQFPVARFAAGANLTVSGVSLTPELVRQKLVAEYRLARAGPLPQEMV